MEEDIVRRRGFMVMPSFKRPGMQFTEAQRIKNLRIAIERGKCNPLLTHDVTNLTIVSLVKIEYGLNSSISGLKMMVKLFFKFLHALTTTFSLLNLYF